MSRPIQLLRREKPPCGPACVEGAWRRLERWFRKHQPEVLDHLNPGATAAEIASFEKAIGQPLPQEVRQSFQLHNGSDHQSLACCIKLLSLEGSLREWSGWQSIVEGDPEIMQDLDSSSRELGHSFPEDAIWLGYINSDWIPLSFDEQGNNFGIDLDPGDEGLPGQIINFGRDEEHKFVLAWTWGWFLTDLAEELERGNFHLDPDYGLALRDPPDGHFYSCFEAWSKAKTGGRRPQVNWAIDPTWLSWNDRTVLRLARSISEERAFDRLGILGDALEEAGCTDAAILGHCRQPGDHGRGCWLVESLLGKSKGG
jgi:cell wall assembly regulator SMI1